MRVLVSVLALVALSAQAEVPVEGTMHIRPFVEMQTIVSDDDTFDQQYAAFGATFAWQHFELDLSHGQKQITCADCRWDDGLQSGSAIGIRLYPTNLEVFRPYLGYQHISDLFRGPPFDRNEEEPTVDYPSVGVTISHFKKVDIDLSYGRPTLDCDVLAERPCHWSGGYQIRVRFFPMKTYTFKTLSRRSW